MVRVSNLSIYEGLYLWIGLCTFLNNTYLIYFFVYQVNTVLENFATNVTKRSMSGKRIFGYVHPPITGEKKYSGNVMTDSRAFHQNLLRADSSHWLHVSKHFILTFLFPALSLVVACSPVLEKILIFTIVSQWFPAYHWYGGFPRFHLFSVIHVRHCIHGFSHLSLV